MPRLPTPDPIRYLVNRKYPEARPTLARIIDHVDQLHATVPANSLLGLAADSDFDQWSGLSKEAEAYRKKLSLMPEGEVDSLYKQELEKQREEDDQKRFFNHPDAGADFDFWSKAAHWTLDEAVALTFGKEPRVVFWKRLDKILSYTSPFVQKYMELRDLTARAKHWQKLYDPVLPGIYIGWIQQNDIPFPQELEEKVRARGNQIANWKEMYDTILEKNNNNVNIANEIIAKKDEIINDLTSRSTQRAELENAKQGKPLPARERETLLKIIIGMAMDGYGHDPKASKSPTAKELEGVLDQLGIPVSDDTIRKWLKESVNLLPPETE